MSFNAAVVQHTSYTLVDPLGFWNPPVLNGAQSQSRNEGTAQKPRLGDNEWKHCHSRGDIHSTWGLWKSGSSLVIGTATVTKCPLYFIDSIDLP